MPAAIHIHYTSLGLILRWTGINVFRCIACCIIHLVILFNTFKLYIQGDHATMHMNELPMFTHQLGPRYEGQLMSDGGA